MKHIASCDSALYPTLKKCNCKSNSHTPTPGGGPYMAGDLPQGKLWVDEKTGTIRDDRNRWIVSLAQWTDGTQLSDAKAYAEFIVRAVNSHEELVEGLKQVLAYLEHPDVDAIPFSKRNGRSNERSHRQSGR